MIHYAISQKIVEQISITNKERFLFGACILPDASSHEDDSYDKAHYERILDDHSLKGICFEDFYEEYKGSFWSDDLFIGYYCHLIQDAIWFHDIVDKHIRIYPREEKKQKYKIGYADYERLNYLLMQHYSLKPFNMVELMIPVKGFSEERIHHSVELFDHWFEAKECEKSDLELYSWDMIMEYIQKSAHVCCNQIVALKSNSIFVDPVEFFVVP